MAALVLLPARLAAGDEPDVTLGAGVPAADGDAPWTANAALGAAAGLSTPREVGGYATLLVRGDAGVAMGALATARWWQSGPGWDAVPVRLFAGVSRSGFAVCLGTFALRSMDGFLWAGPRRAVDDVEGDLFLTLTGWPRVLAASRGFWGGAVRVGTPEGPHFRAWAGIRALADGDALAPPLPPWSRHAVARVIAGGADLQVPVMEGASVEAGGIVVGVSGDLDRASSRERAAHGNEGDTRGLLAAGFRGRQEPLSGRLVGLLGVRRGEVAPGGFAEFAWQALSWLAVGPAAFAYGDRLISPYGYLEDPTVSSSARSGGRAGAAVIAEARRAGLVHARVALGFTRSGLGWALAARAEGRGRVATGLWLNGRFTVSDLLPSDGSPDPDTAVVRVGATLGIERRWRLPGTLGAEGGWLRWPDGDSSFFGRGYGDVAVTPVFRVAVAAQACRGLVPGLPFGAVGVVSAAVTAIPTPGLSVEAGYGAVLMHAATGGIGATHTATFRVAWTPGAGASGGAAEPDLEDPASRTDASPVSGG